MVMDTIDAAKRALSAYDLERPSVFPVEVGLIHVTFRVVAGARFALQRVNPIFDAQVHLDIEAVTQHLQAKGLVTPRLVPTAEGKLWAEVDGQRWRLLTWIDGDNLSRADGPARTKAAGRLLGRFHAAVQDLDHEFQSQRLGVHDTSKHLANLQGALDAHPKHRLYDNIAPLAQTILQRLDLVGELPSTPDRVVHGDPKLNNMVFDAETGDGLCLIDLDTFARMPVGLELGDAFRSWCNPTGEDATGPRFDHDMFASALEGYAEGSEGLLSADEVDGLVGSAATIMLELSARFAADALEERYFGWDASHFSSRGEHNRRRAEVQLALAEDLLAARGDAERSVRRHLGGSPAGPG